MFRNWGPEPIRGRLFERGDMKYVILELLQTKPRHGYEIMRDMQEQSGGWYQPSAGVVYPTLELLADMEYVTVREQDGKKVYAITAAGEQFLAEHKPALDEIRERVSSWWGSVPREELRAIRDEVREFGRLFDKRSRGRWTDPEKLREIRAVMARARREIEEILVGDDQRARPTDAESREHVADLAGSPSSFEGRSGPNA
jgi:DNA-binding PadR family transcriptional regulator